MYKLNFKNLFLKKEEKFIKNNFKLQKAIDKTIDLLSIDPMSPFLKSHKVIRKNGEKAFSSRVNSDFRIIWDYQFKQPQILDIIDIGGHSGNGKVYK